MRSIFKYILTFLFIVSLNAQDFDFFTQKSTIGGYGELHYNVETPEGGNTSKKLDFHRFVLFYSHSWSEKWSFKAEVELEHNFVQAGQGELELEQAYVNYHHADWFGFQAGVILPSVGLINEFHEPPLFFGVERPEYHSRIIPTTWFGNGLAIYGNYEGFDYKISVMEGLDADGFSASSGIRGGRLKGFNADAEQLLYNARLDYLGLPGLKVGASFTYNKAKGDSTYNAITLIEGHAQYIANNLHATFEIGNINYDSGIIESSFGYYFDLGYNISDFLGIETQIIPFARYTDYNTANSTTTGGNIEEQYHFKKWMVGFSVKPIEQVVFKVDYGQRTRQLDDAKVDLFNLGVGYMF